MIKKNFPDRIAERLCISMLELSHGLVIMKETVVEQNAKTYFTDRFRHFSVSQQGEVQFGTRYGIADAVTHHPIGSE